MHRPVLATVLLLLAAFDPAPAVAQAEDNRYDPHPATGDLVLPMPGGLKMVFRSLPIPGNGYWGDSSRIVQVGDAAGRVYEDTQRRQIGGTFPVPGTDEWVIYLGKYEVTRAQYVAVAGGGDEAKGLAALLVETGNPDDPLRRPDLPPTERQRELSKPVSWIGWLSVQRFMEAYTSWCYATPECLGALPKLGKEPGFFRLPTELEWEYAARGGLPAIKDRTFDDPLPFPFAQWKKYAHARPNPERAPTRIGSFVPINGLYDLYGNVAELTAGLFHAELSEGKPGALVVRGGSYDSDGKDLRASQRSEVPFFQRNLRGNGFQVARPPTVGFRLAIGSLAIPEDSAAREAHAKEYAAYRQVRPTMPPGRTMNSPAVQATEPLDRIEELVGHLQSQAPATQPMLVQVLGAVNETRALLYRHAQESAFRAIREAINVSGIMGETQAKLQRLEATMEPLALAAQTNTTDQQRLSVVRERARYMRETIDQNFRKYQELVTEIAGFPKELPSAMKRIDTLGLKGADRVAYTLLNEHLEELKRGGGSRPIWAETMARTYATSGLW